MPEDIHFLMIRRGKQPNTDTLGISETINPINKMCNE